MRRDTFQLGRLPSCDLVADDGGVSKRHANLTLTADGGLYVSDLGTSNGTFLLVGEERRPHRQGAAPLDARVAFGPKFEMGVAELIDLLREAQRAIVAGQTAPRTVAPTPPRRPVRCTACGAMKDPVEACPNCGADTGEGEGA